MDFSSGVCFFSLSLSHLGLLIMKRWCQNHQQMRTQFYTHSPFIPIETGERERARERTSAEIYLNWQSFIYALQNPHRIIFKWRVKEKKMGMNTIWKKTLWYLFISLSALFFFYLFNDFFCSRVVNGQRYHTKFWAMACREFLILNGIAHCWYNEPSDIIHCFYFTFVLVFLVSVFFSFVFQIFDAVWLENEREQRCKKIQSGGRRGENESSNLLQKTWQV